LALNPVGVAILNRLFTSPHQLTIVPWPGQLNAAPVGFTQGTVILRYSPETWWSWASQQGNTDPGHNRNSDDGLVHELVHVSRMMEGRPFMGAWSTPRLDRFNYNDGGHGYEEFYAIVVTNIYLPAGGRDASRRDDHAATFTRLGTQDATHRNPGAFARAFY